MANMIERNTYLDIQEPNGDVERHFPYTKFNNIEDVPPANNDTKSFVKLYDTVGENEDGALSQKTASEKLTKIQSVLQLLTANSYIIDDVNGKTYKVGSASGQFYFEETDVSPKEVVDMLLNAVENLIEEEDDIPEETVTE